MRYCCCCCFCIYIFWHCTLLFFSSSGRPERMVERKRALLFLSFHPHLCDEVEDDCMLLSIRKTTSRKYALLQSSKTYKMYIHVWFNFGFTLRVLLSFTHMFKWFWLYIHFHYATNNNKTALKCCNKTECSTVLVAFVLPLHSWMIGFFLKKTHVNWYWFIAQMKLNPINFWIYIHQWVSLTCDKHTLQLIWLHKN